MSPRNRKAYAFQLEYVYLNRKSNHLSCEYADFPALYMAVSVLWGAVLVIWVAHGVVLRRYTVLLHDIMSFVPTIKIVRSLVTHALWQHAMLTGESDLRLQVAKHILSALYLASLFGIILAISKGLFVVRWRMTVVQQRTLIMVVCWILVGSVTFDFMGGFFIFLLVMILVIILRLVFVGLAQTWYFLYSEYNTLVQLEELNEERLWVTELMRSYSRFRTALSWFVFSSIMLEIMQAFVISYKVAHMYPALRETIDLLLVISVGFLFRPRCVPTAVEATGGQANNTASVNLQEITARLAGTPVEPPQRGGAEKIVLFVLPAPKGLKVRQGPGAGGGDDARAGGVMGYEELLERVALGVDVCASSPNGMAVSATQRRNAEFRGAEAGARAGGGEGGGGGGGGEASSLPNVEGAGERGDSWSNGGGGSGGVEGGGGSGGGERMQSNGPLPSGGEGGFMTGKVSENVSM